MRSNNSPIRWLWALTIASGSLALVGADWPRFRGPDGSGSSDETGLPVRWSETEGLLWKTELPGPGSSSPIVSAGRIFATCYSGYGVGRGSSGSIEDLRRHVVCLDPKDGKVAWDRSFQSESREADFRGMGIPNHGYASSTPVADGERVFAFFGTAGVIAYDFAGKELWRAAVAPDPRTHMFGTASSPVLYKDLLIVPASVECEAIVAFDKRTGAEKWRASAAGYGGWFGTPVLAESGERTELIVSVPDEIWSLNPETGKLYWYAESFPERTVCPSLVVSGGVAYAIGGRQGGSAAVRIGGRGNVTESHRLWSGTRGSYVPSPVVLDGHLLWVSDNGVLTCVKAESGERAFDERRLEGARGVYASVLAADGKLYAVTRRNGAFVLEAKAPEFLELAHNEISSDDSDFNASPAVSDGRLFLRSNRFLYAIGKAKD